MCTTRARRYSRQARTEHPPSCRVTVKYGGMLALERRSFLHARAICVLFAFRTSWSLDWKIYYQSLIHCQRKLESFWIIEGTRSKSKFTMQVPYIRSPIWLVNWETHLLRANFSRAALSYVRGGYIQRGGGCVLLAFIRT